MLKILQPAYQAFTDAIRTFPYAETDFVHRAASTPPHELFESSPALKELASIVDKVTYQGLCDLMLPAEKVSLHNVVEDPYIVGALLERQIESLEPFLQKSTVASAIPVLVNMVTDLYASYNAPIRRVRVLLRCLALGYTNGPDAFNHVGKPDRIVADIEHSLKVCCSFRLCSPDTDPRTRSLNMTALSLCMHNSIVLWLLFGELCTFIDVQMNVKSPSSRTAQMRLVESYVSC